MAQAATNATFVFGLLGPQLIPEPFRALFLLGTLTCLAKRRR